MTAGFQEIEAIEAVMLDRPAFVPARGRIQERHVARAE